MADRNRDSWWDVPVTILIAIGVVLLITTFVVKPFSIPSGSMEPTLNIGDRVLVNKLSYDLHDVHRGDIIVFDDYLWGAPRDILHRPKPAIDAFVNIFAEGKY